MNPGQQVTSTLRLSRQLGQGAMGSVWVADHLALGTQVAVKFMSPAYADQSGFVERFRREAMAAAQIKSPHVAQVFDHGVTAEGVPYIVMELLEGEDLKTRLQRVGVLSPPEVSWIVSQTAKALGRAHQLGIVHRDVKPDNIFLLDVEGEPFVKVVDFGVAKRVQGAPQGDLGMTSTGSVLGTPLYMSPEQLLSAKHVDFRADLWGLAVVAYHALTGQVPFRGETLGALSVALHNGIFLPPSAVRPGLSPAIDAWMKKALELDPAARFASARQMAEALERAVLGVSRMTFTTDASSMADPQGPGGAAGATPPPVLFGAPPPSGPEARPSAPSPSGAGGTPSQPGARPSAPSPSSRPGGRISTTGAPGRTLAGMATSGADGSRRWAPALLAAALAFGALVSVALYLTSRRSPVVDVAPTSDGQVAHQVTAGAAQPTSPAASALGAAAVPASAAARGADEPARADAPADQANTAADQPGTAAAPSSHAAAKPGAAAAPSSHAAAKPSAPSGSAAAQPGTTPAPRVTNGRGRVAPKDAASGRTAPRPPEDTIGF